MSKSIDAADEDAWLERGADEAEADAGAPCAGARCARLWAGASDLKFSKIDDGTREAMKQCCDARFCRIDMLSVSAVRVHVPRPKKRCGTRVSTALCCYTKVLNRGLRMPELKCVFGFRCFGYSGQPAARCNRSTENRTCTVPPGRGSTVGVGLHIEASSQSRAPRLFFALRNRSTNTYCDFKMFLFSRSYSCGDSLDFFFFSCSSQVVNNVVSGIIVMRISGQ